MLHKSITHSREHLVQKFLPPVIPNHIVDVRAGEEITVPHGVLETQRGYVTGSRLFMLIKIGSHLLSNAVETLLTHLTEI